MRRPRRNFASIFNFNFFTFMDSEGDFSTGLIYIVIELSLILYLK